ncbi:response regulator [Actinomadura logoneensis]|uniref:Response regulator n=1 Tax=Actinomadura logoneensis TaxID=2293572 RepID=A0A372JKI6_9ACTN|nr:response regulator [Actinomadura logoneensis]RFU39838.1 response regulator [Actinomadura logoneensis]
MADVTKILAVDDRADNLVALRAVLDALPVEVVCANSGRDALRALLGEDFGLILMDLVMPGMDGLETARHIRSRPRTRHVPIIFLTASGVPDLAPRIYAAGAADLLGKPFDPWLLRAKVTAFVELDRHQREQLRQAAAAHRVPEPRNEPACGGVPAGCGGARRDAGRDAGRSAGPPERRLRLVDARLREIESLAEELEPSVPPLCAQVRALRQAFDPLLREGVAPRI